MTEDRTCKRCEDQVSYLSSDDLCDGCVAETALACGHEAVSNGVCMECGEQVGPITVTLALSGLPGNCTYCGAAPPEGQWALGLMGNVLSIVCPRCFTAVAPVRAVAAEDPDCE